MNNNILSQLRMAFGYYIPAPAGETEIVWLEYPGKYKFVRAQLVWSKRRRGKPNYTGDGKVIGYTNLHRNAVRKDGSFVRRLFYLQKEDLQPDCIYLKKNFLPIEGVRPLTLRPGYCGNSYDLELPL